MISLAMMLALSTAAPAAAQNPAVQRDGDALRALDAALLRLEAEQGVHRLDRALARLTVDEQFHAEALSASGWPKRARVKGRATAGSAPRSTSAATASAVTGASR